MGRIVKRGRAYRVLAMFLAIVMVISVVPLRVFAALPTESLTDGGEQPEVNEPDSSGDSVTTDIGSKVFVVDEAKEFTVTTQVSEASGGAIFGYIEFAQQTAEK